MRFNIHLQQRNIYPIMRVVYNCNLLKPPWECSFPTGPVMEHSPRGVLTSQPSVPNPCRVPGAQEAARLWLNVRIRN